VEYSASSILRQCASDFNDVFISDGKVRKAREKSTLLQKSSQVTQHLSGAAVRLQIGAVGELKWIHR
jgi:hypothetical protein